MRVLDAAAFRRALPVPAAIDAMATVFAAAAAGEVEVPDRGVLRQSLAGEREALLLTMTASWIGRVFAAKVSSFIADNPAHGYPAVQGVAALVDAPTGRPLLVADAAALTARRTAAMVGLATRHLAREQARTLGIIGTGALAADMVAAVRAVRPIERLIAFNRSEASARALVTSVDLDGDVAATPEEAAAADVVVVATSSVRPVFDGEAVRPGAHVNAVGNFSPTGRELDGALVERSRRYVDGYLGTLAEAGDLLLAAEEGRIPAGARGIVGDLAELVSGACRGRGDDHEITLFKSVGTAVADLAGLWAAERSGADRARSS